ncbi:MAG: hypothetical protein KTR20_15165 [Cellvibrionaceae bacterium]|nr:hypothetical protein [Cellvibrionaceae bacterium]
MALPLVPIVIGAGLIGTGGFVGGAITSDKLGSALNITALVVGLFLVLVLMQRFGFSFRS